MPHELTDNGQSFVFNSERGWPWHRLGTPVQGFMTSQQALEAARCNDIVTKKPVYIAHEGTDNDGEPELSLELVEGYYATVSDIYGPMGVVGDKYEIMQCSDLVEVAKSIVGMSDDEAIIDTMGRLGAHGERFFCHIEFPELVIDPNGIADTIRRGLFVGQAFNGDMSLIIGLSNIREVCANTVRMSLDRLTQAIKVRHTLNAAERMEQAAAAVGYAAAAERVMMQKAEVMLRVDGRQALQTVCDRLWPIDPDKSEGHQSARLEARDTCVNLYLDGATNAALVGENGWAAYNAVTEYLDYYRPLRKVQGEAAQLRRLEQTLTAAHHNVNAQKVQAGEAILELAA